MTLPTISKAQLRLKPVAGPYSRYLGGGEVVILIALLRAVSPKAMIEFGCNDGTTARRVLDHVHSIERYIGIDAERGHRTTLKCQQSEVPLIPGRNARDDSRFVLIQKDSRTLGESFDEPCDAVFIDGDHSYDGVMNDSAIASRLLRPGGVIIWHDYGNPAVEVTTALDHLHANDWPIVHIAGTWLAALRRRTNDGRR